MSQRRRTLCVVLCTITLDSLGVGILMPVIPQLFGNPASLHYVLAADMPSRLGYLLLGLLLAIYPTMRFFAAPVLGQLSDRYGRKPVLAVSLAGTTLGYVLFALGIVTGNLSWLFVGRALDGVTGANVAVAQAAVADVTPPSDRTAGFGLIGATFGVGFILGPFIGGVLADPTLTSWFTPATPFWFVAAIAAINTTLVLLVFKETHTPTQRLPLCWSRSVRNIARAFVLSDLRPILLTSVLFNAGYAFKTAFFGVFLISRFEFTERDIALWFAYGGVWVIFTQVVTTRLLASRFSEVQVLRATLLGSALATACYLLPDRPLWVFVITPFATTFGCVTMANIPGLLSRSVPAAVQGEMLGIGASVQALAQSIPPLLGGLLAAAVSPEAALLAAALFLLAGWALLALRPPLPAIASPPVVAQATR